MISEEAVEVAADLVLRMIMEKPLTSANPVERELALRQGRLILEAAAPHSLVHVHHHDIEHHARSFNQGYEAAVTQGLADDPTLADDWFQEKIREARAQALEDAVEDYSVNLTVMSGPRVRDWLRARAVTERCEG